MQTVSQSWYPADIIRTLGLSCTSQLSVVSILDSCSSTNDYLLSCKLPPSNQFNLCVAVKQNAGRGRRAKTWSSAHSGIYLSVSWRVGSEIINQGWLLLMTAVRLAENLKALGVCKLGVKWPNDLYYKDAKLAGMLLEQRGNTAIMGIGLNIETPSEEQSNRRWIGLDQTGIAMPTYSELVASVVNAALAVHQPLDFVEDKQRFSELDILYNRAVEIEYKDTKISGIARGIDEKAHLLIDNNEQVLAYNYGEISIRHDGIIDRCRQ